MKSVVEDGGRGVAVPLAGVWTDANAGMCSFSEAVPEDCSACNWAAEGFNFFEEGFFFGKVTKREMTKTHFWSQATMLIRTSYLENIGISRMKLKWVAGLRGKVSVFIEILMGRRKSERTTECHPSTSSEEGRVVGHGGRQTRCVHVLRIRNVKADQTPSGTR